MVCSIRFPCQRPPACLGSASTERISQFVPATGPFFFLLPHLAQHFIGRLDSSYTMGNFCCGQKVEHSKNSAFVTRTSSLNEGSNRIPQIWYEPTAIVKELTASQLKERTLQETQKQQDDIDKEEQDLIAKVEEWREQQYQTIKRHLDLAARQINGVAEAKMSDEEARIAEARRIVAEADAAIAEKIKMQEECERVAKARLLHQAEEIEANKRRMEVFQQKHQRDPLRAIDSYLEDARKKVEALLPTSSSS